MQEQSVFENHFSAGRKLMFPNIMELSIIWQDIYRESDSRY
jgi:hypothetical protein